METDAKTCKECAEFERCKMWNYSFDACPDMKCEMNPKHIRIIYIAHSAKAMAEQWGGVAVDQ